MGAGRLVYLLSRKTSVRPSALTFCLEIPLLANLHSSPPSPARSPFAKNKTGHRTHWPFVVAGCTTGSLYPWYPYLRDKVLSLYLAAVLSFLTREDAARP